MINFIEVYEGAVALFEDPKITTQFRQNPISFYKTMFPYLQDAIFQFNNPSVLGYQLADYTEPDGYTEEFVGDLRSRLADEDKTWWICTTVVNGTCWRGQEILGFHLFYKKNKKNAK